MDVAPEHSEYIRLLDSLGRYYNTQITAHVGYVITSLLLFIASFSLAVTSRWLVFLQARATLALFIILGLVYVSLGFYNKISANVRILPVYLFARLKYYQVLSQVVWEHMGVNSTPKFQKLLEKRALRRLVVRKKGTTAEPLGVQTAVRTMFEARLLITYAKLNDNRKFRELFELEHYRRAGYTVEGYRGRLLPRLLRLAYYKQIKTYQKESEKTEREKNAKGLDERIGDIFREYGLP